MHFCRLIVVIFPLVYLNSAYSDQANASLANSHAPIGVMGDHLHRKGEWMFSLRPMLMAMDGLANGTDSVSNDEFFSSSSYRVAPESMDMTMLMMGFMYAPSDALTLMVGIPYVENSMDHITRMGMSFATSSYDVGDLNITGLLRGFEFGNYKLFHKIHFNVGLSIPTGDITHKDTIPASMGREVILPYPMQIGSGSYQSILGYTYNGGIASQSWTWGSQLIWQTSLNQNNRSYKWGDRTKINSWLAYSVNYNMSISLRVQFDKRGNHDGRDPNLNPAIVPTADPKLQAFERLEVFAGVNYAFSGRKLKGHRLAFEWGSPISQDLDGPALKLSDTVIFGWQKAF